VLLNGRLNGLRVRTDNLLDLLAVLEQQECGHGTDTEILGDVGDLVDIDLIKSNVCVYL
jgi:hypothetical protein